MSYAKDLVGGETSGRLPIGPVFREPVQSEYATRQSYDIAKRAWDAYERFRDQTGIALPDVKSVYLAMQPMRRSDPDHRKNNGPRLDGLDELAARFPSDRSPGVHGAYHRDARHSPYQPAPTSNLPMRSSHPRLTYRP